MALIARGSGRPAAYLKADGTRVPSVTTILGRFKQADGLMGWQYKVGIEVGRKVQRGELAMADVWKREVRYASSDPKKDVGSAVHNAVEARLYGEDAVKHIEVLPDELRPLALRAFGGFEQWWKGMNATVVATELPMVSEVHGFAGTVDCALRDANGALTLADWKTGPLYADHMLQLAAYAILWGETHDDDGIDAAHILRFSDTGDFVHRYVADLAEEKEQFLRLLISYRADQRIAKRFK